jgi:long-chain acyl-CoA synthetase
MATDVHGSSARIRERLAGQQILVTGSTGFLAKVFVEKLLRSVETIGGIHLLIRSRPDGGTASHRARAEVLRSSVFDRLRAALGERLAALWEAKVHVVDGDLTRERLGLDAEAYGALSRQVNLVVNSAATVTFDERLDQAVQLNTLGPSRLLEFAKDCGGIPFLHVSTCYVCGVRQGVVVEDFSAPEPARESLPRMESGEFDLDALVESLRATVGNIVAREGTETEKARSELIDAGMRQARSHGWNDTYTFTKWIGEQLLVRDRGEVPLIIFRPAIIEGSFEEPAPGWIDGLRMADPIIVAYGRNKLSEFPARSDITIDLIPVDFVANAMIATLPGRGTKRAGAAVFQCASSDRNPLVLERLRRALELAFRLRPMNGDDGRAVRPRPLRFVDRDTFLRRWERRRRSVERYRRWLPAIGVGDRRLRKLTAQARQIEQVIYFAKIYSPYTYCDCRFADDGLRAVAEEMHPADRAEFSFDTQRIDWDDYLVNRHVPGLRAYVLGTAGEPSPRIVGLRPSSEHSEPAGSLEQATNLFELFSHSAEVFADKPALQVRRDGRWIRYTYDEALRATGAIMRRFVERGLHTGDRVAICGENGPEWGLTYLAAMRAGLTAVPLDPQLPPRDAWSAARFAKAKLLCAGRTTFAGLAGPAPPGDIEVVAIHEALAPPPGASRDPAPDPVPLGHGAIASILFTSGTTLTPKAVPLTHCNFLANARALTAVQPIHCADEFLSVLPMYHAFEFTGGFLVPLMCGATITYVEPLKGTEIGAAMQATGTTIMLVVPRLLRMFHDSIEQRVNSGSALKRAMFRLASSAADWLGPTVGRRLFSAVHRQFGGRIRMFVSGGSGLEPELYHAFRRMGFAVYEGYGLTETSPVLTVNPLGSPRAGSVGPPLPNVELDIRKANLEGIGEIWAKGPGVMSGYLDDPAATQAVIVDGWFRTGDLGRRDGGGYVYLTGRSSDLIVTSAGKNVYPDEVELRYSDLPYTKELCVFGAPSSDGLGDMVHGVVVVDAEAAPGLDRSSIEREIRQGAATIGEQLPSHQRIVTLHFWDRDLPKTSTLKAKRGVIRDMVCGRPGSEPGVAAKNEPPSGSIPATALPAAFVTLRRILARQTKRSESIIHPNMHLLLDLGIDSIGKIDLIGAVEAQFATTIDDAAAAKIARVSDLLLVIGNREPIGGGSRATDRWRRWVGAGRTSQGNGSSRGGVAQARWLARRVLSACMNSYVRVESHGADNVPGTGPFILAPNHASHLDAPSVLAAVGGKRRVWVAGAEDYFFDTAIKRFVFGELFDTIPFDRHADGVLGLRRCAEALARGDGLLMFPEGTRSLDGRMQPFKVGAAVLAVEHNAPLVPVRIEGAYELFPKGRRMVRPGVVRVIFGKPMAAHRSADGTEDYAVFSSLSRQLQGAVAALANGASP